MSTDHRLLLLHLSDLHFGLKSRFGDQDHGELGRHFHREIAQAIGDLPSRWQIDAGRIPHQPDLVVVTGDIAHTAHKADYAKAAAFLGAFRDAAGLNHERFVFVPGNHDVARNATQSAELDLKGEEENPKESSIRQAMDQVMFKTFEAFIGQFHGLSRDALGHVGLAGGGWMQDFPALRLSLGLINSCEGLSHRKDDKTGSVSPGQMQSLLERWQEEDRVPWLKFLLLHHNPQGTEDGTADKWREWVKRQTLDEKPIDDDAMVRMLSDIHALQGLQGLKTLVRQTRVQLVLHGHHHADSEQTWNWESGGAAQVLGTGSLGVKAEALPPTQPSSCQLLLLEADRGTLHRCQLAFHPRLPVPGEVTAGGMGADTAGCRPGNLLMSPPAGWEQARAAPPVAPSDDEAWRPFAPFLASYRERLKSRFDKWDLSRLGQTQQGANRPVETDLEKIYLPLRLGREFDPKKLHEGKEMTAVHLLEPNRRLVIRGAAGSGKTTWMRYTFRQLLKMENALPIFVELRKLSAQWATSKTALEKCNFDDFLVQSLRGEGVGAQDADQLEPFLRLQAGPIPVLLVDGWDELGEAGQRFRELLMGFLEAHPRVRAVVTSRPYGSGVPSGGDDFTTRDIQPLNDDEVARMARAFHQHCYGQDETSAQEHRDRFLTALKNTPEAQGLARTALLLTMMLLLSRTSTLPEKRHQLYDKTLENLLASIPDKAKAEGVQDTEYQWCPEDSEERRQVTANLACKMQEEGYQRPGQGRNSPIIATREALKPLLPDTWQDKKKDGFLTWLAERAGVMVERHDGGLSFAHLSFQEFLTAKSLADGVDGDERRWTLCQEKIARSNWWETMRLWAALVGQRHKAHLLALLASALADDHALWFMGPLLADGLGEDEHLRDWSRRAGDELRKRWPLFDDQTFSPWRNSRLLERKQAVSQVWQEMAQHSDDWLHRLRLVNAASSFVPLPLPALHRRSTPAEQILHLLERPDPGHAQAVAVGRVPWGSSPALPLMIHAGMEGAAIHLLPGVRPLAGARLQSLTASGGTRTTAHQLIQRDRALRGEDGTTTALGEYAHDLGRYFGRDFWRYLGSYLGHDLGRYLGSDLGRYLGRYLGSDLWRDLGRDLGRALSNALNMEGHEHAGWLTFAATEASALGRAAPGILLAHQPPGKDANDPRTTLLRAACRVHYRLEDDPGRVEALARNWEGHRLWSALARHVAGLTRPGDATWKALEGMIRDPDAHFEDGPLRWAMAYIARGDVLMLDGSTATLDELYGEAGVDPLPYLEAMPPRPPIDWDKEATEEAS